MRMISLKSNNVLCGFKSKIDIKSIFEGNNIINYGVQINDSYIGKGTYIAKNSEIIKTKIGKFCSIGQNVKIVAGRHPLSPYVSTHPFFYSPLLKKVGFINFENSQFEDYRYSKIDRNYFVTIGNDVWIGSNVTILDGVDIGDGAVVGAGAVVTKDVSPYTIVVGVPAKKVSDRFTEDEKNFLLEFKWWNKNIKWLKDNIRLFRDIKYITKIK